VFKLLFGLAVLLKALQEKATPFTGDSIEIATSKRRKRTSGSIEGRPITP
jgi:hypothetical protein